MGWLVEKIQLAVWDVKALFGDSDAKSHADALREVNSRKTPEDRAIYETVMSAKIEAGGIAGTVQGLFKSAVTGLDGLLKTVSFALRYFPLLLVAAGAVYLVFVLKVFKRARV